MRPTCVPGDVDVFIDNSMENICDGIGEISDALCATVDFAKLLSWQWPVPSSGKM